MNRQKSKRPFLKLALAGILAMILPSETSQAQKIGEDLDISLKFQKVGKVKSDKLKEISGICRSAFANDRFWVHNDSGGKPRIYLLSEKGKKKLEVELKGVKNKDWEDLCAFKKNGKPYILVADVGDNSLRRPTVFLHILEEPNPKNISEKRISVAPLCTIQFTYPDGPRNCESVVVSDQEILLFSKGPSKAGRNSPKTSTVYRLPLILKSSPAKQTALVIGHLKEVFIATAADCSPDGNQIAIRDYARIFVFQKGQNQSWKKRFEKKSDVSRFAIQGKQNEAIGFGNNGRTLWTVSEGKNPDIWRNMAGN